MTNGPRDILQRTEQMLDAANMETVQHLGGIGSVLHTFLQLWRDCSDKYGVFWVVVQVPSPPAYLNDSGTSCMHTSQVRTRAASFL